MERKNGFKVMKRVMLLVVFVMALLVVPSMNAEAKNCADGQHTWGSWETKKAATYNKKGTKIRYCTVSGCHASETKDIAKKKMNSKQKKVYSAFKKYISAAKTYNRTKMSKCFVDSKKAKNQFYTWSYITKIFKKYNKNITYNVTQIKVKGKKATVKAKITTASIYSAMYIAYDETISWGLDYLAKHNKMPSDSKVIKYFRKKVKSWYKKIGLYDDEDTRTVTFNYVKKNGKWKIKSPTTKILDVANMRCEKAYKDICDDWGF